MNVSVMIVLIVIVSVMLHNCEAGRWTENGIHIRVVGLTENGIRNVGRMGRGSTNQDQTYYDNEEVDPKEADTTTCYHCAQLPAKPDV